MKCFRRWWIFLGLTAGLLAGKESERRLDRSTDPRPPKPAGEETLEVDEDGFVTLPGGTVNIVGGTTATIANHPWQAALLDARVANAYQAQFCGGTLVDPWWVVTAAHCVMGERAENLDVLLGTADLGNTAGAQRLRVAEIIIHPRYNDFTSDSDIALLRLSTPATVDRVLLPLVDDAALEAVGVTAKVSGWGVTSSTATTSQQVLREVDVPVVSLATANAPVAYAGALTANMLPAGLAAGGKDSCQGDSGGPLTVPSPVGPGRMLAGVVSFGDGCGQANAYGIYARVSAFRGFLLGHIWPNYARYESTAGEIGENRDRDGDGWTLWDDFVLPERRTGVEIAGGETLVTYESGSLAGEAAVAVEFTPDLFTAWTAASTAPRASVVLGGGRVNARVAVSPAPPGRGFYRVIPGRSGALAFGPRPLEIPGSATGLLDTTDPIHPTLPGHRMEIFRLIGGVTGTTYSISLRSGEFDARLELIDPDGTVVQMADGDAAVGRTGKDELLTLTVAAGQERWLRVSSEVAGQTGAFEIGVWNPSTLNSPTSVSPGAAAINASLSASTDEVNPWFQPGETIVKDDYALNFSSLTAGQLVELRMTGFSLADEMLMIINAETGQWVGVGDDWAANNNDARVHFLPIPGVRYIARATAYSATTGNQAYSFSATTTMSATVSSLLVPQSVLAAGLATSDRFDAGTKTYFDDYLLAAQAAGTRVRIRLNSTAFDTYLEIVEASSLRVIEVNDDLTSGDLNNSGLDFTVRAGERYFIRVSSYDELDTGAYTLTSSLSP